MIRLPVSTGAVIALALALGLVAVKAIANAAHVAVQLEERDR